MSSTLKGKILGLVLLALSRWDVSLTDLDRFPSRGEVNSVCYDLVNARVTLVEQAGSYGFYQKRLEAWDFNVVPLDKRLTVWQMLQNAQCGTYTVERRLSNLRSLREKIGDKAYQLGLMP